ncbi:MAG TPA: glucosamine-6-phosphate deaminase [bacterium]|nr:glucosamine-6-phosphate deaminase [bacterium]HQP98577.1 glucosamine-6-phosphate deaminase [bacterium]
MNEIATESASKVEEVALKNCACRLLYPPVEKIKTVMVDNFPALGQLAALRFIEWVQQNPGGVISLPTGKTPEHFIQWVRRLLNTWKSARTQAVLQEYGLDPGIFPDMKSLHFVQIDEFYPIHPWHENSFYAYVKRFYLDGFGLDPSKALLMDCYKIGLRPDQSLEALWPGSEVDLSLRRRPGKTPFECEQKALLHRIDQWCQEYEDKIRSLGGIGFFLGGIGPDGHIGFNVRGSSHHSITRLCATNYMTQAAAASDLGGIEIARKRLVITIGLGTITCNPQCTAIIIAAGEAKAGVVKKAIEGEKDVLIPASSLQSLPNARFFITQGAAKDLHERKIHFLTLAESVSEEETERILIDLSLQKQKRLMDLTREDFDSDRFAAELLRKRSEKPEVLAGLVRDRLIQRIEKGGRVSSNKKFLHTEPHHDDIMLGYLPAVVRSMRDQSNSHLFATMTSGFTAVTNDYLMQRFEILRDFIDTLPFAKLMCDGYFDPANPVARNRDVWQYLDGVASGSQPMRDKGTARRLLRDLVELFGRSGLEDVKARITEIKHSIASGYPGKKDPSHIQKLKGMCREWEAECLWGYFGYRCECVRPLRLGFYTGDIFTEEPTMGRDIPPILAVFDEIEPDIVSVALDPEASGPDTHYKVLQAVTEALRLYVERTNRMDIRIWGYRNVWYRFHPSEANMYVPVSLNMFAIMRSAFMNTFLSQKDASFPSYEHDGPFCELAQKIQVEQYQMMKTCLGREWFQEHPSPQIRATRGLVFLRELDLDSFYACSRELRRSAENR